MTRLIIQIQKLTNDCIGLLPTLQLKTDIMGTLIGDKPSIGAIVPIE